MSQENVEIVRRSIEYLVRTDENLWETIDAEVEIHDHSLPDAGVYRGHAGWLKWQDDFDRMWEDTGGLEPEKYIDAGEDKVVAVLRMWVQGRGGISVEWRDASVNTLRNGKIVRLDVYGDLAEAFEAVGLRE
jgi:ketosteroid isomerase-like protein